MKIMGIHAYMYVMCIGILPRYVMLVRMHTFDIYICYDIMRVFPFLRRPVTNVLCPTKSDLGGTIQVRLMGPCMRT